MRFQITLSHALLQIVAVGGALFFTMARASLLACLLYFFAGFSAEAVRETSTSCTRSRNRSLFDFRTKYLNGTATLLRKYAGNVTLALNVATYWGFAAQYPHLNALMKELNQKNYRCGLNILAFPCNQFLNQEPGANEKEIMNGLKWVRPGNGFVPNFPLFQKIRVNGAWEDPIYTYLKVTSALNGFNSRISRF